MGEDYAFRPASNRTDRAIMFVGGLRPGPVNSGPRRANGSLPEP